MCVLYVPLSLIIFLHQTSLQMGPQEVMQDCAGCSTAQDGECHYVWVASGI